MPIPQHINFTVAHLPATQYGNRAPLWWGVILAVAIEGTLLVLLLVTCLYLRMQEAAWPPSGWSEPATPYGSIATILLLVSAYPIFRVDVEARQLNGAQVRRNLVVFFAFCAALLPVRVLEFYGLQVKWDSNAYGSITWAFLAFHTLHFVTSAVETGIIAAYVFLRGLDPKHALDLHVTAVYWYFVVASWIPLYLLLYLGPHFLN